jgi:hypothetical protein
MSNDPEFIGVILAGRAGARLFPLTTDAVSAPLNSTNATNISDQHEGQDEKKDSKPSPKALYKHLLPLAGCPVLCRLLHTVESHAPSSSNDTTMESFSSGGLTRVIVAVAEHDKETIPAVQQYYETEQERSVSVTTQSFVYTKPSFSLTENAEIKVSVTRLHIGPDPQEATAKKHQSENHHRSASVTSVLSDLDEASGLTPQATNLPPADNAVFQLDMVHLNSQCVGSADALRFISLLEKDSGVTSNKRRRPPLLPRKSNVILMPGDLVLEGGGLLGVLADAHRRNSCVRTSSSSSKPSGNVAASASMGSITMLVSDVGEDDESGLPLKESAKVRVLSLSVSDKAFFMFGVFSLTCYLPPCQISHLATAKERKFGARRGGH